VGHLDGPPRFERVYPHQLSGGMSHLQQELERIFRAEGITAILVTHDVEEAVAPGDRIVVMHWRPGRIRRIVDVPLARPRRRDAALAAIKDDVLGEFGASSS